MVIHIIKSQALIKVNPFSVLSKKRGTSDRNAGKVSEVPGKRRGPPTEMQEKCRRYPAKERDLRQIRGEFVGGPSVVRGSGGQRLRSR